MSTSVEDGWREFSRPELLSTGPLPRQLMIARHGLGVTIRQAAVAQTVR